MCTGCTERWKKSDLPLDEFVTIQRPGRIVGVFPCQVAHFRWLSAEVLGLRRWGKSA
ncbi:hypothetical protein ABZX95_48885 [Streptomyces sp. NPDC004232]|uniref:hypothetical protein n=1 Tax=Streptomyces sp. NPDC004232 TaxID=3154454 RepID=UPI0033B71938